MSQRIYRLQVTKDQLGFAAAHFITMRGKCERLHGHNYRVTVEVEGFLGAFVEGFDEDLGDAIALDARETNLE